MLTEGFSLQVDELPFLLSRCGENERLKATLSDLRVFSRLVKKEEGMFDLIKYWQKVSINQSIFRQLGDFNVAKNSYLDALNQEKSQNVDLQESLADFFIELGLLDAAR
jgi:hypothetical protein